MRILLSCLVAMLTLAACGGDDEGSDQAEFVSSGMLRESFHGRSEGLVLMNDETFAAKLHDTEVAVVYNEAMQAFIGRIRNEAPVAVCDVQIGLEIDDGDATLQAQLMGLGLSAGQGHDFQVPHSGQAWSDWTLSVETYTCASAPAGTLPSEGSEGGAEHGGSGGEGGGEHGGGSQGGGESGEGSHAEGGAEGGSESGEERSPNTPIGQFIAGTRQGQTYDFSFDAMTDLFEGTVENTSMSVVCASRTEIHVGTAAGVVELGPTIPQDLAPGDMLNVVMYLHPPGQAVTYSLHPESSPCP